MVLQARDKHNRIVIIGTKSKESPSKDWMDTQEIPLSRMGSWYNCYPATGGSVLANLSDLKEITPASNITVHTALANANSFGKETLIDLIYRR